MYQIMIDVSGKPPGDIHVGLILINRNYKNKLIYDFNNAFPKLINFKKKSTHLDEDYLFNVLKFFNEKRLRMISYQFKDFRWKQHERKLNELLKEGNPNHKYKTNFSGFYEKIMGILYFYAITQIGLRGKGYNVTACAESHLDVWSILNTINKLSKREKLDIITNVNIRKVEHLLKMADVIAGASKKIDNSKLETIERYNILRDPIKDSDLKNIFKIHKRKIFI